MAITILDSPNLYQSMHEDLWFVVSSNNTGQTSFKYIFDVLINNQLVARVKSFPQPVTSRGIFNAAPIIRSYWSSYFKPNTTPTLFSYVGSDVRINFVVQYGEDYGGTTYTNLAQTSVNAFNYYPNILNGKSNFDGTYYDANYAGNILSGRDILNLSTRRSDGRCFTSILNGNINTARNWRFNVTRYNGGSSTNTSGGNQSVSDYAMLDLSPAAINAYLSTTFITSSTDYYTLEGFENNISMFTCRVNILCEPRYDTIPLHFLNSLGGYDTFNFTLVNREQRTIDRKSYEQIEWEYRNNGMERTNQYNVFYGGSTPFATAQTINYRLVSDWLNLVDYTWIKDLIGSPEVYMEKNTGEFIPVVINTNTWNEKKRFADKTYNLELDVQIASKAYSQFR